MEQTECSEMSAYKIQTPGNYPEENIQHTEHGKSLKNNKTYVCAGLKPETILLSTTYGTLYSK